MDSRIREKLQAIVGSRYVTVEREELLCYSYDSTAMEYMPVAVVFPGSTAEVAAIMRLASEEELTVVPRGAGTGMTGGALPVAGGLVMAMSRLNRIIEIDTDNRLAVVEPGVITGQLQGEVAKLGLYYPPDPASARFCSMGGNVAECAGGPSAVKYGVTRDYVLGLEVVLADGSIMRTGVRTAKGVAGYDLTRLFVGSEGTLGIITMIVIRLISRPPARRTFLVLSRSLVEATSLVSRILATGLLPCTLEYMDRTAIKVVDSYLPEKLPASTEALLLVEVDGDPEEVDLQAAKLADFLAGHSGLLAVRQAVDDSEVEALWAARKAVSPASFQLRPHKISEDVVVPRTKIPDLVEFIEQLARELDLIILTFGHAGDGNIHVNIMFDRQDAGERQRAGAAQDRLFEKVLGLSGTISGEHGVGLTKMAYLGRELDEVSMNVMRRLKKMFDPANILNPGKMFADREPKAKC